MKTVNINILTKKIIEKHIILKNQEEINIIHPSTQQIKFIPQRIIQEKIWN